MTEDNRFHHWAIVELFGHVKIAGLVSEQPIAGATFVRVDVPEVEGLSSYTKFYGSGAIYAITPVTEAIAMAAAGYHRAAPVSPYEIRQRDTPRIAPAEDGEEDEDGVPF